MAPEGEEEEAGGKSAAIIRPTLPPPPPLSLSLSPNGEGRGRSKIIKSPSLPILFEGRGGLSGFKICPNFPHFFSGHPPPSFLRPLTSFCWHYKFLRRLNIYLTTAQVGYYISNLVVVTTLLQFFYHLAPPPPSPPADNQPLFLSFIHERGGGFLNGKKSEQHSIFPSFFSSSSI